jgi:cytochrome c biogenesis protein CcmG/thiol:disulfide interchange protein DsbE
LKRVIYILPTAVFVLLAGLFLVRLNSGDDPSHIPSPLIDRAAPDFSLPSLMGGEPVTGKDLTGGVTVLNVFASWCMPCRAEHPILMRIAREGRARVVGLNYTDKPSDAKAWLEALGNPYGRIASDRKGRAAIDYGVYGVPETFIIDAKGRIRYKHVGPIMPFQYEETIARIIERLAK